MLGVEGAGLIPVRQRQKVERKTHSGSQKTNLDSASGAGFPLSPLTGSVFYSNILILLNDDSCSTMIHLNILNDGCCKCDNTPNMYH